MPAANDKRRPVGTLTCDDCQTTAALYQVQTGRRRGYLYKRCACGCDQSCGTPKQQRWLGSMTRTDADMIPHPLADETPADPAPEPKQPEPDPETDPDPEPVWSTGPDGSKRGAFGFLLLAGGILLAAISN